MTRVYWFGLVLFAADHGDRASVPVIVDVRAIPSRPGLIKRRFTLNRRGAKKPDADRFRDRTRKNTLGVYTMYYVMYGWTKKYTDRKHPSVLCGAQDFFFGGGNVFISDPSPQWRRYGKRFYILCVLLF